MGTRLHIVVSEELVARVDEARGLVPRSAWLRAAVEQALASEGRGSEDPGVSSSSLPAPAEQPFQMGRVDQGRDLHPPVERLSRPLPHYNEGDTLPPARSQTFPDSILPSGMAPLSSYRSSARSSVQAKRDVRPVPKAGEK